jgi:serine/threonine protein kinase
MEYLKGKTIKNLVAVNGPLGFEESKGIINQLLNAVEVVHNAGMLHRDIKPDNIILTDEGRVVLIDFGSARAFTEGKTVSQTAMVSPGFAPMEQYNPNSRKGTFTDVYSIGATLYFMLTGVKPLNVTERYLEKLPAPHELNAEISIPISSAVMLAMEMKPEDRFQNVDEFRQGLMLLSNYDEDLIQDEKTVDLGNVVFDWPKLPEEKIKPESNPELVSTTQNSEPGKPKNYKLIVGIAILLITVTFFAIYSFSNKDTDGDGVADNVDLCPEDSGNVSLDGCPDSDNDGVVNQQDKCPDISGNSTNGCFYYKSIKFRNRTPIKASLALAYLHNNKWCSEGWYTIEPNSTTEIKLPEGFTNKEIYWSANSNNLQWVGSNYFCVNSSGRFKNEFAKNTNCEQKGFFKLALKGENTVKELLDK